MKTQIFLSMFTVLSTVNFNGSVAVRSLEKVPNDTRVAHARELLGKRYDHTVVKAAESTADIQDFVYSRVRGALKGQFAFQSWQVANAIIEEGRRYQMDPLFILAVIEHESVFNPLALGSHGEIGLMQIKPDTAEWIAHKLKLNVAWNGPRTLTDMVSNIRIGTAYMAYLRKSFKAKGSSYVTAYNMGSTSLRRALAQSVVPHDYSTRVMRKYVALYSDAVQPRTKL